MGGKFDMPVDKEQFSVGNLFKRAIKNEIAKIHTSIPAEVTKINTNNTVDVRPLIKDKNLKGELVSLPVISEVPIQFFRDTDLLIAIPIRVGMTGSLHFAERSIKNWQLDGGQQAPEDNRRFNLTDCYFSTGLMKNGDGPSFDANLNIIFKDAKIVITPTGEINVENSLGHFTIKADGKIEVEGPEIKLGSGATNPAVLGTLLQASFDAFVGIYNTHTHMASGMPPQAPLAAPLNPVSLSTKVKVE
jgi:hypothetical protein